MRDSPSRPSGKTIPEYLCHIVCEKEKELAVKNKPETVNIGLR